MQASYAHNSQLSLSKRSSIRRAAKYTLGSVMLALVMLAQPAVSVVNLADAAEASRPGWAQSQEAAVPVAEAKPATGSPMRSRYFSPTGKSASGVFLSTFERFGLERIGYPLSEERQEGGRTVQYFERVRMEYHPELASKGYSVLLTRLGVDLTQGQQFAQVRPFQSTATKLYVKETGHSLSGAFLSYWQANGEVELFGYPISEPSSQNGLTVQWFERARMEHHPGKGVQLGLLGRQAFERTGASEVKVASARSVTQPQLSEAESSLLLGINQQRAAAGAGAVQINPSLADLARSRSSDMAQRNYFSHTTPEGKNFLAMLPERGVSYKYAGEILARNNYADERATQVALESYLGSPAHKAIMLDGRFTHVGVGYAKAENGMHYYTVIFVQQ